MSACKINFTVKNKNGEEVPSLLNLEINKTIDNLFKDGLLNLNENNSTNLRYFKLGLYATIVGKKDFKLEGLKNNKSFLEEFNDYYKDDETAFDENGEPKLDKIISMKSETFLGILNSLYKLYSKDSTQSILQTLENNFINKFNNNFNLSDKNLLDDDNNIIKAYKFLQDFNNTSIIRGKYYMNLIFDNGTIRPEIQKVNEDDKNFVNNALDKYNDLTMGLFNLGLNPILPLYNTIIFNTYRNSRTSNINYVVEDAFNNLINTVGKLIGKSKKAAYVPNLLSAIETAIDSNGHFNSLQKSLTLEDINNILKPANEYIEDELSPALIKKAALQLIYDMYVNNNFNEFLYSKDIINSAKFLLNLINTFYENVGTSRLQNIYNDVENLENTEEKEKPEEDEIIDRKRDLLHKVTLLLNRYFNNKNLISHNYKNKKAQERLIETILLKGDSDEIKDGFYQFTTEILAILRSLDASTEELKNSTNIQRKAAIAREIQITVKSFDSIKAVLDDHLADNPTDYLNKDTKFKQNMKEISSLIETYRNTFKTIACPIFAEFLEKFGITHVKVFSNNQMTEMSISEYLKNPLRDITFFDRWLNSLADSSNEILRIIDMPVQKTKFDIMDETNNFATKIMAAGQSFKNFKFLYEVDSNGKRTGLYVDGKNLTGKEKEFYDIFMSYKEHFDEMIPVGKQNSRHTIKILKNFTERLSQNRSIKGFGTVISNSVRDAFIQTSNDNDMALSTPHLDAEGRPLEYIPLHYINLRDNESEEDVSMDAVSTLIAYANMAITYDKMNEIVNGMEIARAVITNSKLTQKYKEGFSNDSYSIEQQITTDIAGSNTINKLNDYFASNIYNIFTKDQGTINVLGKQVSIAKSANTLNMLTSLNTIAGNIASAISNVATGTSIMLTEASSGEFFNIKDLAWADLTINKVLPSFIANRFNRIKTDKLSMFMKYSNMMDKFEEDVKNVQFDRKSLLKKVLTTRTLFIMMGMGETWMYSRTALSLAHNTFLIDKATKKRVNLWDALEVKYIDNNDHSKGGDLYIPTDKYSKEDGTAFTNEDRFKFINRLHGINQKIHGIYNKQDRSQAERGALGRMVLLFRKWMKTAYDRRFHSQKYNYLLDSEEEGYYRTFGRVLLGVIKDLRSAQFSEALHLNKNLSKNEKANMRRAITELSLFFLVVFAKMLVGGKSEDGDDPLKDSPYAKRLLTYQVYRLYNELGALVPLPTMIQEGLKIANSPAAGVNTLEKVADLLNMTVNPGNWFGLEDIKSGEFKGHSPVYRSFMRTIPGVRVFMKDLHPEQGIPYYKNNGTY